jgi:23S rRNA G2069 N7-methylase RlmK/C1962 C5-methylase RlmI
MRYDAGQAPVKKVPESPVETGEIKTGLQAEMFENRLRKRRRHLKKWARRIGADAYRLYDRDIPEIPLVLDLYGDAVAGALYKRPYEKDEAEEDRWLGSMAGAVSRGLGIPESLIFLKRRERQRGKAQYGRMVSRNITRDVHEGGLLFRVNLSDYLDTGLFLDRRNMRALVRAGSAGKRVLNLFCYTASFSVYAAAGGAAAVDSVDMSNTYLDWAGINFGLNGYRAEIMAGPAFFASGRKLPPCRLIRSEASRFLNDAAAAGLSWDTIILDPPTFSNSKKMSAPLDIRRDYRPLISRCLALLRPGGTLWFSANARSFRLAPEDFPGVDLEDLRDRMEDEDFREKKAPPCYTLTVRNRRF